MGISAISPGKINLFLDVTGKLPNGYHEILTLFLPIYNPCDCITIEPATETSISTNHPDVPTNHSNLCWKAIDYFNEAVSLQTKWHLTLEKNLPVAGGMGGGSSNAAAVLRLLNKQASMPLSEKKLHSIALKIGADVPFFLNPETSLATGVGDKIQILKPRKAIPILLVTFEFPIAAAWSYQNRLSGFNRSKVNAEDLLQLWQSPQKLPLKSLVYNDLSHAIRHKFPILQNAVDDLIENGATAAEVSGSGPTVFAVFDTETDQKKCLEKMLNCGYPSQNLILAFAGK